MADKTREYYGVKAVSQSLLTQLSYHPRYAKFMLDGHVDKAMNLEDTPMVIGSIVDTLITERDKFDDRYHVTSIIKPSGAKALQFCNHVIESGLLDSEKTVLGAVKKALKDYDYRPSWAMESRLQELEKARVMDFLEEYKKSGDKFPIDEETAHTCEAVAYSLENGEFTKEIFTLREGKEIHNQVITEFKSKLFDEWLEEKFPGAHSVLTYKAMCDIVVVDHNEKTIKPYDLKVTSGSLESFPSKVLKYRYDIQKFFYEEALRNNPTYKTLVDKFGYVMKELDFIVESYTYPGKPLIFKLSRDYMYLAMNGGKVEGREYKGLKQLIPEMNWHTIENRWDYDYEALSQGYKHLML